MMEGRVRRITRQRASHFILGEEGKVGSRSAFVASTVVVYCLNRSGTIVGEKNVRV